MVTGILAASPAKFQALRVQWAAAHEAARTLARELERKYGHTWSAPAGKAAKYTAASNRADAAMEAVFAWLDVHSPRCWRSGPPAYWVCESLTFADAMTAGRLAVTPPCAYGRVPSDMVRFAMPVQEPVAAGW